MDYLDSFDFDETVNGVKHFYRITNTGEKYEIEKDGKLLAELAYYEKWEQESGETLQADVFDALTNRIESYNE